LAYEKCLSIRGFMLLPASRRDEYYGVDRFPFEPEIPANPHVYGPEPDGTLRCWIYWPLGWKRDAYKFYEEHKVMDCDEQMFLIADLEAASEVQNMIEPHLGPYEVVEIEGWHPDIIASTNIETTKDSLGYDVAYLGGDLNSALYQYINLYPALEAGYKHLLNERGLFSSPYIISDYLKLFRETVRSEANAEFLAFRLSKTTKP